MFQYAKPWVLRELNSGLARLRSAGEDNRTDVLFEVASEVYELVHGGVLPTSTVMFEIRNAGFETGLDHKEVDQTIRRAKDATLDRSRRKPKGRLAQATQAPREDSEGTVRQVRLTPASAIAPRPVRWLWTDRVPLGEVTLTPGRGGIGKSTFHAWLIAAITSGTLEGAHQGFKKPCIIAATEDSWERTIVPRLIVAGADLEMVYRADVISIGEDLEAESTLTLPLDCTALEEEIARIGAVLLSVDPLMSSISGTLDTHKDREVRRALEPLGRLADRTGCVVLGNAHFNKSNGADPLSLITGSAAFGNVARAALGFARNTEADDGSCVISQVKNNLGKLDLPSLRYRIEESFIDTDDGKASVGRLVMDGTSDLSVSDLLQDQGGDPDERTERDEAAKFIKDYLIKAGGTADASEVTKAAMAALQISKATVTRARHRAKVRSTKAGMDGGWVWSIDPNAP